MGTWWNFADITPNFLYSNVLGSFYVRYTTHGTYGFTSHPEDEAIVLAIKDTRVSRSGLEHRHPVYQKHQSLSQVLLFARPLHAKLCITYIIFNDRYSYLSALSLSISLSLSLYI